MDLKKTMNTDYLGSWDFTKGEKKILTVKEILVKKVFNPNKNAEENTAIMYFTNHQCGLILNTTNKKMLIKLFGTSETESYHGKNVCLITSEIKVRGEWIEAVRIDKTLPQQKATEQPKEKELFNENHKGWLIAVETLANGGTTVDKIMSKYQLTPENEELLRSYEPKNLDENGN